MEADRHLQDRAHRMRRDPTEWEKRLWRALSASQTGFKFRRQAVVENYICDFLCPQKMLVVEVDGDTHDLDGDAVRDARLAELGYKTVRVSNLDVRENIEGVVLAIVAAAHAQPDRWSGRPHPNPSPEGEGLNPPPSKPLPFRGGVGVGEVSPRPTPRTNP